jgi:hypothetical protein
MDGTVAMQVSLDALWTRNDETRMNVNVHAGLVVESGSAGRTRTYNPSVTHDPIFSHGGGLSHQLP